MSKAEERVSKSKIQKWQSYKEGSQINNKKNLIKILQDLP